MSNPKPSSVTIRTYAVGFGDCFLLSFSYPKGDRHVLIDFGTTSVPKNASSDRVLLVARDIERVTRGKLHAVVATHRHADHISGFATKANGKGAGNIIRALRPDLVVQPWTEDPRAQVKAKKATRTIQTGPAKLRALAGLEGMHQVARAAAAAARTLGFALTPETRHQLSFLGEDNIKNVSAVRNLMSMPKAKRAYVRFGSRSGLERVLPGVKVHVLGPPTLQQTETIRRQRSRDDEQFWQFWTRQRFASGGPAAQAKVLFPRDVLRATPPSLRWFEQRVARAHGDALLQLVRILDSAMNNTSVILLFEIGSKRLLFPGDAQIENWEYALSKPAVQKLLAGTTLYKVGHHGSLNATPRKALWPLFKNRSRKKNARNRLVTLLSTREDKHGHSKDSTEVPRSTLVTALKKESKLLSTLDYKEDELARLTVVKF